MLSRATVVRILLAFALTLVVGACGKREPLPGNITVGAYMVPGDRLAAWAPTVPVSDRESKWVTPNFAIEPANNPHRVVVDFEAELAADVAVAAIDFDVVWLIKQEQQSGGPLQRLWFDKGNLKVTGGKVTGRAVGPPLSFREKDLGAIEISLEKRVGLKPTAMTISVRSGIENASWLEMLLSIQSLMIGLVFLALVLWMRR